MHVELNERYRDDSGAREAADLISACVHCGFCLETCPTYLDGRDERDSPRGRIYLLRQLLQDGEAGQETRTHLDRCLTCRSCETTCPSGMRYGRMLDHGRALVEQAAPRPTLDRWRRDLLRGLLTRPALFSALLRLGQALRPLLPTAVKASIPTRQSPGVRPARRHDRVMLTLEGCVQQAATPATNAAAARVLDRLGISLVSVSQAGCCGAVNHHLGAHADGLDDMRRNIDAWWPQIESGVEAIVTSASGCGATVAEYGELLAHDPDYRERASRVSALHRDIGQVMQAEKLEKLGRARPETRVAVHLPCSLQHGLGQAGHIPAVLERVGYQLAETSEPHLCCGSAGTYSILQRATSGRLRDKKLAALELASPSLIATANVGCELHLQAGGQTPVVHWVELLDRLS